MQWQFEYTGYIWPMVASAAFLWALAVYTWRHRAAPGAAFLACGMFVVGLWALAAAFETLSADLSTKLFWFRLKNAVNQSAPAFALCFVLEYSGLGRWITRPFLALMFATSVAIFPMMFIDDSRMLWTGYWMGETIHRTLVPMGMVMNVSAMGQFLLSTLLIAALFVRSPLHRAPAALIILGHLTLAVVLSLEILNIVPDAPLDLSVLSSDFTFTMYAIALYKFRIFDVVPLARQTVLERMQDGMLVLDTRGRIADLNPAAQELFGTPRPGVLGRDAALALAALPDLVRLALEPAPAQVEVQMGRPPDLRWYQVSGSPLTDRGGFRLGRLLVFRDITERKRAQALLMEQQLALAALQERERVARELHDGLGQVLGFVKMQARAAQELLARDPKTAASHLAQLAAVAQDAHADIREYILGARLSDPAAPGFLAPLRQYLERFSASYGLSVELAVPLGMGDQSFGPAVQMQLLRIIQEALTNARKHARAHHAQVKFAVDGGTIQVTVADDGQGFDPGQVAGDGQKFGLRFMRERAEEVGGTLEVHSAPGQSTRVVVRVPRQDAPDAAAAHLTPSAHRE